MTSDAPQRSGEVRIDVFGGVTAERDGEMLAIGGRRQRLLLAVLAVEVGHVVPIERLLHIVWSDSSPTTTTLHSARMAVSRLRSTLERSTIKTTGAGYRLDVEPVAVSSIRFCHAVELAIQRRQNGDLVLAMSEFDQALAAWTGPPFADVDRAPVLAVEIERLSQFHRTAEQHRVELLLELGRIGEAIAGCQDLIRRLPFSEQPCRVAMLALQRGGRTVDAVRCFQEFRHRLADETGLVPSEDLQRLERDLLNKRTIPEAVSIDLRRSETSERHNLAHRSEDLIGRNDEITLVRSLVGCHRSVTIVGPGGIGKSRIALEVAWHSVGVEPDGVWWCDLAPIGVGEDAAVAVAAVLGATMRDDQSPINSVSAYCQRRRMTLVLDNCEHVLDSVAALATRLHEKAPGVTLLATSREHMAIKAEQVVPLGPLPDDGPESAAVQLFVRRATEVLPTIEWADHGDAIESICQPLAGLPLAIELAAGRVRSLAPADIADQMGDLLSLLRSSRRGDDRHRTIDATIRWSYSLLSPNEQTLFRRLSVFAGGWDLGAAVAIGRDLGLGAHGQVAWLVERLVDRSMVSVERVAGRARYKLLEPLRQFAERELGDDDERWSAITDHGEYYVRWVEAWDQRTPGDTETWASELQLELGNLRVAVRRFIDRDDVAQVERIVCAMQIAHFALPCLEVGVWARLALEHPLGGQSSRSPILAGVVAMSGFWTDDVEIFHRFLAHALSLPGLDEHSFFPAIAESISASVFRGDHPAAAAALGRIDRTQPRNEAIVSWASAAQQPLRSSAAAELRALRRVADETGSPLYDSLFHHASGLGLLGIDQAAAAAHAIAGIAAARRAGTKFMLHHNVHILAASGGLLGTMTAGQLADVSDSLRQQRDAGQALDQWLIISGMARVLARSGDNDLAHAIHRGLEASSWRTMHDTAVLGAFLETVPRHVEPGPVQSLGELVDAVIVVLDQLIARTPTPA